MALISKGLSENVYQKIEKQLPAFMGFVFEDICKQYLWQLIIAGTAPIEFIDIGRWWTNKKVDTAVLDD